MTAAYKAFEKYCAVRAHFDSKYDYFKYNGRIKYRSATFDRRHDRLMFLKLAKKPNLLAFLVANLRQDSYWVGDLLKPEAEDRFLHWKKVRQSISYVFDQDCRTIASVCDDLYDAFHASTNTDCIAFDLLQQKRIEIETFVIIANMFALWDETASRTLVYSSRINRLRKYVPWLQYDHSKLITIVNKHLQTDTLPIGDSLNTSTVVNKGGDTRIC